MFSQKVKNSTTALQDPEQTTECNELDRLVYIAAACLRLLRCHVCEIYPNPGGYSTNSALIWVQYDKIAHEGILLKKYGALCSKTECSELDRLVKVVSICLNYSFWPSNITDIDRDGWNIMCRWCLDSYIYIIPWENITLLAVHRNVIFHDRPGQYLIYIYVFNSCQWKAKLML